MSKWNIIVAKMCSTLYSNKVGNKVNDCVLGTLETDHSEKQFTYLIFVINIYYLNI